MSTSGTKNFFVTVRVRPLNQNELFSGKPSIVQLLDSNVICFDPQKNEILPFQRQQRTKPFIQKRSRDLKYAFDYVFDERASQKEVFQNTLDPLLDSFLEVFVGFNCTGFAYGNTGAGKTYTMLGCQENPGIMVLAIQELYRKIERDESKHYNIELSYLEVYNESIRDLLSKDSSESLPLREDSDKGMVVVGLTSHKPANAEEVFQMLAYGNNRRTQHPTDANSCSSRSHAVFCIYLTQRGKAEGLKSTVKSAKLLLIDLAGSERASGTSNKADRMREGANINKSLLSLGNCINALVTNSKNLDGKKCHVPYRDSKLTRLLKDALGGNSKTVMIANISPSSLWYEDTHNTLKYANRAKNIKAKVTCNKTMVQQHVSQYANLVKAQELEINRLTNLLKKYEEGNSVQSIKSNLSNTEQFNSLREHFIIILKRKKEIKSSISIMKEKEMEIKLTFVRKKCQSVYCQFSGVNDNSIESTELNETLLENIKKVLLADEKELSDVEYTLNNLEKKIRNELGSKDQQNLLWFEIQVLNNQIEKDTDPQFKLIKIQNEMLFEYEKLQTIIRKRNYLNETDQSSLSSSFIDFSLKENHPNALSNSIERTDNYWKTQTKLTFNETDKSNTPLSSMEIDNNFKEEFKIKKKVRFNLPEIPSFMKPTVASKAKSFYLGIHKENTARLYSPSRVKTHSYKEHSERIFSPLRINPMFKTKDFNLGLMSPASRIITTPKSKKNKLPKRALINKRT